MATATRTKNPKKAKKTTGRKPAVSKVVRSKKPAKESAILQAVHEAAVGLHSIGLMDKATLREFDAMCLPKLKTYTPAQIKSLREKSNASQAVFAAYLNTSPSTVQKWERGNKRPAGPSLKLLNLVESKGLEVLA